LQLFLYRIDKKEIKDAFKRLHMVNELKKLSNFLSVISRHKLDHDHMIDWRNANILDSEQSYYKRMVSEMIHIKRQENGLNKQSDTERFPKIYLPIIEKNPNRTTLSTIFFSPFLSHYINTATS